MKKINLSITGCTGRMGQQLIKSSKSNKNFKLVSLTENKIISKKISGLQPKRRFNAESQSTQSKAIEFTSMLTSSFASLRLCVNVPFRFCLGYRSVYQQAFNPKESFTRSHGVRRAKRLSLPRRLASSSASQSLRVNMSLNGPSLCLGISSFIFEHHKDSAFTLQQSNLSQPPNPSVKPRPARKHVRAELQ